VPPAGKFSKWVVGTRTQTSNSLIRDEERCFWGEGLKLSTNGLLPRVIK